MALSDSPVRALRYLLGVPALCAACISCSGPPSGESRIEARPGRIVSLDYCADQYLLQLADRSQILALSPDATKSFSYLRDEAHGLPSVRATAEDVLSLRPDLVVRSYGGGPLVGSFLERAGVPVVQLPWVVSVDGDSQSSVTAAISLVAARLGQDQRGRELIAEFRLRLRNVRAQGATGRAMYMSAAGFTSGSGTLISDLLATAGLQNYETRSGWHPLPLEALVYDTPERVASSFFGVASNHKNAWSAARHPIANQLRERGSTITLDGATTACGAWFIADAAEALAGVRVP